jgi:hypothetical protein
MKAGSAATRSDRILFLPKISYTIRVQCRCIDFYYPCEKMLDDLQTTEDFPEPEEDRLMHLNASFFIGWISLALAWCGVVYVECGGLLGILPEFRWGIFFMNPMLIGIPATLLSIKKAFILRRKWLTVPISVVLFLAYAMIMASIAFTIFRIPAVVGPRVGNLLIIIIVILFFFGIPIAIMSRLSSIFKSPNRLHISAMLLLAHFLFITLFLVLEL